MTLPEPAAVARELRQHDNEFEAVYDLLNVVDGKIDALEAKVDSGFEQVEARFAGVDSGFERVDDRLARLESGQQQILDLLRGRADQSPD